MLAFVGSGDKGDWGMSCKHSRGEEGVKVGPAAGGGGQLMSSAPLSSRELLLKHFLSIPNPWAGEAGVLELDLHFCPLPLSSQEQEIETSREGL